MEQTYKHVSLTDLKPSPLNPRKHFNPAKLAELADSMKGETGILEPLVVRPNGKGFEIVAGERRWRAAQIAALTEAPVIVRKLSDAQVLEIMVIENNQRDDVTPLEEARGYRALIGLDKGKYSAAAIAEKIGRSEKYVWDRMKLLDLIPESQQLLDAGKMTAGHAILLARLKPEQQKKAIHPDNGGLFTREWGLFEDDEKGNRYQKYKAVSVREFEHWIGRHVRFDVAHFAAAAPLDFGETAQQVEAAQAKPGRGKKVVAITHEYIAPEHARSDDERTFGSPSWKRADGREKSKTCEFSVLGVVAAGDRDYGRAFDVCVARDRCVTHWKQEMAEREKRAKQRTSGQPKRADQSAQREQDRWKRQAEERQRLRAEWETIEKAVYAEAIAAVKNVKKVTPTQAAVILEDVLSEGRWAVVADLKKHCGAHWYKNLAGALLVLAVTREADSRADYEQNVAKPLGLKLKALVPPPQTSAVEKTAKKKGKAA